MLYSLSRAGNVPALLGTVNRRGVPWTALCASTAGMAAAVILVGKGSQVFLPLFGTAVAAMLSIWITILTTHLRFRRRLSEARLKSFPLRLPFFPCFYPVRDRPFARHFGGHPLRCRGEMDDTPVFTLASGGDASVLLEKTGKGEGG